MKLMWFLVVTSVITFINDINEVDDINFQTGNKKKTFLWQRFFQSSLQIWVFLGESLGIEETNIGN